MNIRYAILPILVIFLFISGLMLGECVENISLQNLAGQASSPETASGSKIQNLSYIWSVTGVETDPIVMALGQDGTDLFGRAKYEPDSGDVWNGVVDGSISENNVKMTITAQKGKNLESIKLDGVYSDDALSGKFTRISEGKITARGDFNAVWISQNISYYKPAEVVDSASQQQAAATLNTALAQQTNGDKSSAEQNQNAEKPVKLGGKTKYVDVHEYAEKIGPGGDLSGVPPGMGGSGL